MYSVDAEVSVDGKAVFYHIAIPTDSNNNLTSGLASGLYTSRASFPTGNHGTLSVFP